LTGRDWGSDNRKRRAATLRNP